MDSYSADLSLQSPTPPQFMPYKMNNRTTAEALCAYWQGAYGQPCVLSKIGNMWQITPANEYPPMWREICDAFRGGRVSLGMTAD